MFGPDITNRPMFGCPAFFVSRRLVPSVYKETIGFKLPAERVTEMLRQEGMSQFRPYNKPAMRQWLAVDLKSVSQTTATQLLQEAVHYARGNDS